MTLSPSQRALAYESYDTLAASGFFVPSAQFWKKRVINCTLTQKGEDNAKHNHKDPPLADG